MQKLKNEFLSFCKDKTKTKNDLIKNFYLQKIFYYIITTRGGIVPNYDLYIDEYIEELKKELNKIYNYNLSLLQNKKNKKNIYTIENNLKNISILLEELNLFNVL